MYRQQTIRVNGINLQRFVRTVVCFVMCTCVQGVSDSRPNVLFICADNYTMGDEELYDHCTDPHEWNNLAAAPATAAIKRRLAQWLPIE